MEVGIGLPNAVPGAKAEELLEFARRADALGFSSLGTIDRIVYPNYEPLAALAAAAAVTERIGLLTSVLLGPLRPNAVALAKQALTLNALSDGRFTLGIGLGARGDDYEISEIETSGRGRELDRMLERMTEVWAGDEVGPSGAGGPRMVVGGHVEASFARAARWAEGWIMGAAPPELYPGLIEGLSAAWEQAGRSDSPRTMALAYYSLGDGAEANARAYLTDYYAFLGTEIAEMLVQGAATDRETVQARLDAFGEAGCGELIFVPCSSDPEQADLLAEATGI